MKEYKIYRDKFNNPIILINDHKVPFELIYDLSLMLSKHIFYDAIREQYDKKTFEEIMWIINNLWAMKSSLLSVFKIHRNYYLSSTNSRNHISFNINKIQYFTL